MKERPIIFSGEMVRAIMEGRKTMTRRVVKAPIPDTADIRFDEESGEWYCNGGHWHKRCPLGQPGDRLWVRETMGAEQYAALNWNSLWYVADDRQIDDCPEGWCPPINSICSHKEEGDNLPLGGFYYYTAMVPAIFMPRWASRINLEVTNIKLERVQEISWQDALDEGVEPYSLAPGGDKQWYRVAGFTGHPSPTRAFRALWDSINGGRGYAWAANPWVWVLSSKRVEVPV